LLFATQVAEISPEMGQWVPDLRHFEPFRWFSESLFCPNIHHLSPAIPQQLFGMSRAI